MDSLNQAKGNIALTEATSDLCTAVEPRSWRLLLVVFLVRMWRLNAWPRLIDPLPRTLKRFAALFLVFILGMMQNSLIYECRWPPAFRRRFLDHAIHLLAFQPDKAGKALDYKMIFICLSTTKAGAPQPAAALMRRRSSGNSSTMAARPRNTIDSGSATSAIGSPFPMASALRNCVSAMGPRMSPISTGAMGKS